MRSLDPEEAELWARVTASIRPFSRRSLPPPKPEQPEPEQPEPRQPQPERAASKTRAPAPPMRKLAPPPRPRPGTTLDGNWDRRLKSGSIEPDRILDLHGLNLGKAWSAIDTALDRAIDSGDRVVLLITGHARPGDPPIERGRIRAAVHDWLAASRHASKIAAVRPAHGRHGGGGSLYIVLRRR